MKRDTWSSKLRKLYKRSPTFLLGTWFFLLLVCGTCLLALPLAHRPHAPEVTLLSAAFTAVSAFCVTGLTVVETHDAFSPFGQAVILVLIELGGVGIMTFASLGFSIIGRRMSMTQQAALTDALFQQDVALEFRSIFATVIKAVVLIQLAGVFLLFLLLLPVHGGEEGGLAYALWSALFHSVSAFCNAGFSIYRDNLVPLAGNWPFLSVVALLVILGGLGHAVLAEMYLLPAHFRRLIVRPHWLNLNSRVCLIVTLVLLVAGAAAVSLSECLYGGPDRGEWIHWVFHSVVARTAGFNATPLAGIPLSSCLFLCLLMFVGGSPASCAGGVKTTSLAIWIARIRSSLRHDAGVDILGFSVAPDLVSRARLIITLSALWVAVGVVVLSFCQPDAGLDVLLFEQISALATVGLSMGYTTELGSVARVWIMISMIMGKFGPLSIALWVIRPVQGTVNRPEARIMIG